MQLTEIWVVWLWVGLAGWLLSACSIALSGESSGNIVLQRE